MSELNPHHSVMPTQKTDLLNHPPSEEIDLVKEHLDIKISLLAHLDLTHSKINSAIIMMGVV